MLTKIFSSSTQSFNMEADSASVRYLVEAKGLTQYFVSEAYFKTMLIFDTKYDALCACSASARFAPMLVTLRKSCLEKRIPFSFHLNAYKG